MAFMASAEEAPHDAIIGHRDGERKSRARGASVALLEGGDNHFLRTTLRERKVDVAITRRMQALGEPDLVTEILFQDPLFVVAGSRNCLSNRTLIGP